MAQRFKATIESDDAPNTMTFIEVPANVMAALGPRKRVPVRAEVRAGAGVAAGDRVSISIEVDDEPRTVQPPPDLARALRAGRLHDAFLRLAPTHQKEYVQWLESAKRPETRTRRATKIVEAIREKAER